MRRPLSLQVVYEGHSWSSTAMPKTLKTCGHKVVVPSPMCAKSGAGGSDGAMRPKSCLYSRSATASYVLRNMVVCVGGHGGGTHRSGLATPRVS